MKPEMQQGYPGYRDSCESKLLREALVGESNQSGKKRETRWPRDLWLPLRGSCDPSLAPRWASGKTSSVVEDCFPWFQNVSDVQ